MLFRAAGWRPQAGLGTGRRSPFAAVITRRRQRASNEHPFLGLRSRRDVAASKMVGHQPAWLDTRQDAQASRELLASARRLPGPTEEEQGGTTATGTRHAATRTHTNAHLQPTRAPPPTPRRPQHIPLCTDGQPLENLLEAEREQNKQLAARVAELEAAAERENFAGWPSTSPDVSDEEPDDSDDESERRIARREDKVM